MHAVLAVINETPIEQEAQITFRLDNGGKAGLARLSAMHAEDKIALGDMDIFTIHTVLQNLQEYFSDNRTYTIAFTSETARREFLYNIGGDLESAEVVNCE